MDSLLLSTPQEEGASHFSRYLQITALIDPEELKELFFLLNELEFYQGSDLTLFREGKVSLDSILGKYTEYIETLKNNELPLNSLLKRSFSLFLTKDPEKDLYAIDLKDGNQLVKIRKPVIQMRLASFTLDASREKILPMLLGKNEVTWGLNFTYPLIYQKTMNQVAEKVDESENFPNTIMYKKLARFLKKVSQPVIFDVDDSCIKTDLRISKRCFPWIEEHKGLSEQGIRVKGAT